MGGLTIAALGSSALSFLQSIAKIVLKLVLLVVALSAVVPLLPGDPFREGIIQISATWEQWADLVNWIIPSGLILTSTLFGITCYIFFFGMKILLNMAGMNFFRQVFTDPDVAAWDGWNDIE